MAVREIIRMGHPTLRQVTPLLTKDEMTSDRIRQVATDLADTLHDVGIGVGIAAPQINESVRMAIIELDGGESRYGTLPTLPLTVFINPVVEVLDDTLQGLWEGCLSLPDLRGYVERPQRVKVTAYNLDGEQHQHEFEGLASAVIQHELDHLDGKLFVDHVKNNTLLMFEKEFDQYIAPTL
ncbi:MAG: peptide deformylase [Gammaproteobacteria bacterium]|nr:peptide deformylase [Gammaproteobacteria bacterium]